MIGFKDSLKLDHEKSMRLFNISAEAEKMKVMAKNQLKKSKGQITPIQREELKAQAKYLTDGANVVLKEAREMHFKGATTELIGQLDEILEIVKSERKSLELMIKV
ncbi:hypothetical protein PB01_08070 [Psychrobacillus glaciei]|uniref:Uncharacterized protein n=1 Tax=Psychrobacillus glaciei TaxID=2283160 RepID=A0A5J6SLK2_9BACI|nr:hypothetical protein [Psychrobacillus glaciei]QFF98791.1 hypothetical protein PB01_08070 [Psychrobacillus glaciei]